VNEDENKQKPEGVGTDPAPGKPPESAAGSEPVSTPASAGKPAPETAAKQAPESSSQSKKVAPATKKVKPPPPRQGSNGIAWFAVLVALAAMGLAGWVGLGLQRVDDIAQRTQKLSQESAASRQSVQQLQQQSTEMQRRLESELTRQVAELRQQREEQYNGIQNTLQSQRQQLLELRSTDRADWSLAEAEYLLRLAHQRLLMADDLRSALALLSSVDAMVAELDDPDLHALRGAIAADAAALRAIPEVDVEGIWLRIRALSGEVDSLLLFKLPDREVAAAEVPADADWQQRLEHGFRSAMARLASYVMIKRREEAYQPLMDPQWERLVRQNLRMLLEQSQAALLSGNRDLYQQSLADTRHWLAEFFSFRESAVSALDRELEALLAIDISRDYPGVSDSLSAVKTALNARHAAQGGG
jgi:uroporphyrin-3 C-methyltransferase